MSTIKKHVHANNDRSSKAISGKDLAQSFFSGRNKVIDTFFAPTIIQPKLEIGQPNDKYEQQADRVADAVVQRKCAECEAEERLQMKENGSVCTDKPASVEINSRLQSSRGSGRRLPEGVQSEMTQKIGADFSGVNIHTGFDAIQMSQSLGARAFTHGNDIYFNSGEYNPATYGGKHLLAHELTHVVQQETKSNDSVQLQPSSTAELNELCYEDDEHPSPDASEPEHHFTYESWISSFHGMRTFEADDTVRGGTEGHPFQVLGSQSSVRYGEPGAEEETEPVPTRGGRLHQGEQFIDHPTNEWVENCLPTNLRATAYELPSDCADVAVILRHVWLSANNRTESYNGWVVGDRSGRANQGRASSLIRNVYSGNVRQMVNPYSDSRGNPIRSFDLLQNLLHPGDILVWEHREIRSSGEHVRTRRTGGHVQTISFIDRNEGGTVQSIRVLQGNQPIFADSGAEIANALVPDEEQREQEGQLSDEEQNTLQENREQMQSRYSRLTRMINRDRDHAIRTMRNSPGRRIEVSVARTTVISDPENSEVEIWGRWDNTEQTEYTVLVAAGPPRSADLPSVSNRELGRRILDWDRILSRSNRRNFTGKLEAMLHEARSLLERDQSQPENQISESDFQTLAETAGNELRSIYIRRRSLESLDTTDRTEFLQRVSSHLAVIEQMAAHGNSGLVQPMFNFFARHFVESAAPSSTVEELRSYVRGPYGPEQHINVFQNELYTFQEALAQATDFDTTRQIAESNGRILWQHAGRRAQDSGSNTDDRPLYWTRLRMIQEIRYADFSFNLTDDQRSELIEVFKRNSRGMETARFPSDPMEKRVVISGFDPFGLHTDLGAYNPSGAAVLALDGETIRNGDISARVEGVIFPVRFRDFNQGTIEQFFGRYLAGNQAADMIMTISRGGSESFEVERYAGRRRSSEYQDNEALYGGGSQQQPTVPPGMRMGDEFLETSLPHSSMTSLPGVEFDQSRYPEGGQGTAVSGSGGGYLSNEIFYRVRRLSLHTMGADQSIRVGHLHTPLHGITRNEMVDRIRDIIQVSIPHL